MTNITVLLLKQIVIMFVLIMVGYILYKKGMITNQGSKDMGNVLLYIVLPVVIINNFCIERSAENVADLLHALLLTVICSVIAIAVAYAVFGQRDGVANLSCVISNAGFIGIPLVSAALGGRAVFHIALMIVAVNLLLWTYGVFVMTGDTRYVKPQKIFGNPTVIAVAIGLVIFVLNLPVPALVRSIFSSVSAVNTPLAMFILGIYLAQTDLGKLFAKPVNYKVTILRLAVIPVLSMLALKLIPLGSPELKMAILLAAACPVGSAVPIFAMAYDRDYKEAVELVCLSTIICLVTLPLIVTVAGMFL
ncbi:MAG: AEC family transporter [Solobacterium sp.]|nr:AEC family transporter [Solobacterium sp.]